MAGKVSLNGIDLSTSVKPIAISDAEALEKAKKDNETQAQFKDDTVDGVIQTRTTISSDLDESKKVIAKNTVEQVKQAMVDANNKMDVEAFNKANEVIGNDKESMKKQMTYIFITIAIILLIILAIELPAFIETFLD